MRALVTGATGFIGGRLLPLIAEPVVLSRNPQQAREKIPRATHHYWDPLAAAPPADAFAGVEAVFHLAGESVGEGRWTAAKKQRIRDSRIIGTQHLVEGLAALEQKPRVLVVASAIGYYGSRGDETLDESSAPGNDFLAHVCRDWEAESRAAEKLGIRVVNARFGIVLGQGGALKKMLLPFKLGAGGRLGDGRQWMSWVHVDDVVGLLLAAATDEQYQGPVNTVAPTPVTNREFTRVLASVLHRPAIFPVPAFGLRLAVGEFAEVLLGSQRVLPKVAQRAGYAFHYPVLDEALRAVVEDRPTQVTAPVQVS
jgi:uncharacterized protein (TIGR01777 family)